MKEFDYLIIGSGIIGLAIAKQLKEKFPDSDILVLEKEPDVAYHSSGRNSGVLHAGFYYTADSLKAKFTKDGNDQMRRYCYENKLKINECKKVVIAKNQEELDTLYELEKRGKVNGVDVSLIDEKELEEIDPNVKTYKKALFSPNTATVDPIEINHCLKNELKTTGVTFYFGEAFKKRIKGNIIITDKGAILSGKKIINAAGLYADKVAKDFGFSKKYNIIPFKGVYLKYKRENKPVKTNVYPVPDLNNPFLGVHYTLTVDGTVKIGPTSIPAFWRENYQGMRRFKINEIINILSWELLLFITNAFKFRRLAINEVKKYNKKYFVGLAKQMVKDVDSKSFCEWTTPGIRVQLLNVKTKELVMDFVIEGDKNSTHVLNAVSPAFTCCFPFAEWVVDNYIENYN